MSYTKRKIVIPEGVKCPECGETGLRLRGAGRNEYRINPEWKKGSDIPKRIRYQRFGCKVCGCIFIDKEHGIIGLNGQ